MLNFLWFALGLGALLVALCLCTVLLRLHRTLSALEQTLMTADESLREIVPEVQGSLGNVNNLTAGVNLALRSAGSGASRVGANVGDAAGEAGRDARAAAHGVAVGFRAFWRGVVKKR
ncbi:MAG TPA: DUF948 domain-containing protein [Candidatus Dormibacteraeota bacterium]|jgi:hypothetical protein|nr:DUF948 domain-containing protein [Candidatus Dormibacteraeota bacterium]